MALENIDKNFRAVPDESRIPDAKKDEVMKEVAKLEETLRGLFPVPCRYGVCNTGEYSGLTIVDRLIDTEETRIGDPPQGLAKEGLIRQGELAIARSSPVALVGIYGTPRSLNRPELNSAQLADLAAIMMVQGAMDRVYSAHEPGASYRMVDENLVALWLDIAQHRDGKAGAERFKKMYSRYFQDRQRLLDTLAREGAINTGHTKIELLSESDLYEAAETRKGNLHDANPEIDFFRKCEAARPIILNYLISSGAIVRRLYGENDAEWQSSETNPELWTRCRTAIEQTSEYAALKDSGWSGLIPPEMRSYYLAKFRNILGGAPLKADDETLLFHIATYLTSTLIKHKAGTLTEGLPEGAPIIRVPLVRPVDGRPPTHQSLIAQRTLPKMKGGLGKRISNTNRAAWLSLGAQGGGKLRLVDTAEFESLPEELIVPVQIYMTGATKGKESYLVDTAILLDRAA